MILTDRKLKGFFPTDNRFIHFVAKKYGYTFWNDDNVNNARYHSIVNVTRYLKKYGYDFEDEGKIVSMLMYSIRYGILESYSQYKKKNERLLDIRTESEFVYDVDSEMYNAYTKALAVDDDDLGGLHMLYKNTVEYSLTETESNVLSKSLAGYNLTEIDNMYDLKPKAAYCAKKRIVTKFKNAIKLENKNEKEQQFTDTFKQEQVQKNLRNLRADKQYRSLIKDEEKRSSYVKAIAFLYPEEEV